MLWHGALCYLVNVDQILEKVIYNMGIRNNSAILPMKKEVINPAIQFFPYDPNKGKSLLTEAGWKDTDGDGILGVNFMRIVYWLNWLIILINTNLHKETIN